MHLSSGAIGGIVAGIVGGFFILGAFLLGYVRHRGKATRQVRDIDSNAGRHDTEDPQGLEEVEDERGGRLKYPIETLGGRLASDVVTSD